MDEPPAVNTESKPNPMPHWSVLGVVLIVISFLMYAVRNLLDPLILCLVLFVLLFSYRKTPNLRSLFVLVTIALTITIWHRFSSLLTPFLIAFILAYILNPPIEWLTNRKIPRPVVISGIVLILIGAMIGLGTLIIPRLAEEGTRLAKDIPSWVKAIETWGSEYLLPMISRYIPIGEYWSHIQGSLLKIVHSLLGTVAGWSANAFGAIVSILTGILNLVLIPILATYFLIDYRRITQWLHKAVPITQTRLFHDVSVGVNRVLAGYFHGQILVILFLSMWIWLGLWLIAGVPYGLLLGLTAGLMNLLPYVGTITALILTIIVSVFQPEPVKTTIIAIIVFQSAQIIEANWLTPKLVGEKVGLHPVLAIFLVLFMASVMGFVGMLIAIPLGGISLTVYQIWAKHRETSVITPPKEPLST